MDSNVLAPMPDTVAEPEAEATDWTIATPIPETVESAEALPMAAAVDAPVACTVQEPCESPTAEAIGSTNAAEIGPAAIGWDAMLIQSCILAYTAARYYICIRCNTENGAKPILS
jgi:hypothetical protein